MLSGQVKLSRVNPGGDEAVVHIYGTGESFAEAAMFLGRRYPVAAEAVVRSRVMHVESDALRRKVAERPEIAFAMMASMSWHLKALVDQIEKMKLLSADQRVCGGAATAIAVCCSTRQRNAPPKVVLEGIDHDSKGASSRIEVLGRGQQFVAFGSLPSRLKASR